ncbi:hypothetical protein [Microbispora sp. GKU 823]|nr:hypothetical protein [Microbispora sp. GKU 823]
MTATTARLVGGIPWRGGPQLDQWAEDQYRAEQADYDLGDVE